MKSNILKLFTALLLVLCLSMNVSAQKQAKSSDCLDKAKTQSELNDCTGQSAAEAEQELNKTYQSMYPKEVCRPARFCGANASRSTGMVEVSRCPIGDALSAV
jgi:uncharacterized protein YecT (DUF1311 family)